MEVTCKLTKEDIEQVKIAREILHAIKCTGAVCAICPLFVDGDCLANTLSRVIREAEGGNHDN